MKKSKTFVNKWVKHYSDVNDLPDRNSVQKPMKKENRVILRVFEKNPRLSLRGGQAILRKKSLNISCDTIRRLLLAHEVKFQNIMKKPLLSKKHVKKIHLGERKFGSRLGQDNFFEQKFFSGTFFFIIPGLPTLIDSSSRLLNIR